SGAGREKTPRFEVGAQFSSLAFNQPQQVFFFSGLIASESMTNPEAGFGGRFTYNLNEHVGLEAQGDFYPRKHFSESTVGGYPSQAQFGVKAGKRFDRIGVFGKARPGFVNFSSVRQLVGTQILTLSNPVTGGTQQFTIGIFDNKRKTYFSTDVGGVVEFYPSRRIVTRFDVGDTIIRYSERHAEGFSLSQNIITIPAETKHNLQVSAGIGVRF
ncbi:MAG: hypothetical protein WCD76_17985, partial [Pyrinomonadaceae bacterium]